jgi:putative membrane protein
MHTLALTLASGGWHHNHCWIVLPILALLVLVAVVLLRRRNHDGGSSPQRILAERFARGEITGEEYRDRLAQL